MLSHSISILDLICVFPVYLVKEIFLENKMTASWTNQYQGHKNHSIILFKQILDHGCSQICQGITYFEILWGPLMDCFATKDTSKQKKNNNKI